MAEHWHESQDPKHDHAFPTTPHSHTLRAICNRPICDGFPTHNVHSMPVEHIWQQGVESNNPVLRCRRPKCGRIWRPWETIEQQGACCGDTTA